MKASENDLIKRVIALLVPISLTLVGAHPASSRTQPAALDHVTVAVRDLAAAGRGTGDDGQHPASLRIGPDAHAALAGLLTGVPPTGRQAPQAIAQSKSRLRGYLMP